MRAILVSLACLAAACGSPRTPIEEHRAPADASLRTHPGSSELKHLELDETDGGIAPRNHRELLWGDYIDARGNPAVGWHSHDPVTGNAR